MPRVLLLFFIVCLPTLLFGQSQLARLKFEQAELSLKEGFWVNAIEKLNETEKILGQSNPRTLHLRIMAENGLLKSKPSNRSDIQNQLVKHCLYFLENYKAPGLESLYREVQSVSETVNKNNSSGLATAEKNDNELESIRAESERQNLFTANAYMDKIEAKYKFKKGEPISLFTSKRPEAAHLFKTQPIKSGDLNYYNLPYNKNTPYPIGPFAARTDETSALVYYTECLFSSKDDEKSTLQYFSDLKSDLERNFDSNYISFENEGKKINVAILGNDSSMEIKYLVQKNWTSVTLTIK